jgi:hypothetical protein
MQKKTKKIMIAMFTVLMLMGTNVMTSYAGQWIFNGPESWKWWWQEDNDTYPANSWKEIDGKWYHFDSNGYLEVGWKQFPGIVLGDTGNIYNDDDAWYHFGESGAMTTSGKWEDGLIWEEQGTLYLYYSWYDKNSRQYKINNINSVTSAPSKFAWKHELANKIYDDMLISGPKKESLDVQFQLPANWSEESPLPGLYKLAQSVYWVANWDTYGTYNPDYIEGAYGSVDSDQVFHFTITAK